MNAFNQLLAQILTECEEELDKAAENLARQSPDLQSDAFDKDITRIVRVSGRLHAIERVLREEVKAGS